MDDNSGALNPFVGAFSSGDGQQLDRHEGATRQTLNPFGTGDLRIDTSVPTAPAGKKP